MIPLLGMACVAWTAYEILRLVQAGSRPVLASEAPTGTTSAKPHRPRRRNFAAWDETGRPIDVDDLGRG